MVKEGDIDIKELDKMLPWLLVDWAEIFVLAQD